MRLISNILFSFLLGISVAGCAAIMDSNAQSDFESSTIVKVGEIAPDFTVASLDGTTLSLSDYKGKTLLLVFFSSWCGDCQELMAGLDDVAEMFSDRNFDILAISRGEEKDAVSQFVTEIDCHSAVALDPDSKAYSLYATKYVPRCFVISPLGRIVAMSTEYSQNDFELLLDIISTTAVKRTE